MLWTTYLSLVALISLAEAYVSPHKRINREEELSYRLELYWAIMGKIDVTKMPHLPSPTSKIYGRHPFAVVQEVCLDYLEIDHRKICLWLYRRLYFLSVATEHKPNESKRGMNFVFRSSYNRPAQYANVHDLEKLLFDRRALTVIDSEVVKQFWDKSMDKVSFSDTQSLTKHFNNFDRYIVFFYKNIISQPIRSQYGNGLDPLPQLSVIPTEWKYQRLYLLLLERIIESFAGWIKEEKNDRQVLDFTFWTTCINVLGHVIETTWHGSNMAVFIADIWVKVRKWESFRSVFHQVVAELKDPVQKVIPLYYRHLLRLDKIIDGLMNSYVLDETEASNAMNCGKAFKASPLYQIGVIESPKEVLAMLLSYLEDESLGPHQHTIPNCLQKYRSAVEYEDVKRLNDAVNCFTLLLKFAQSHCKTMSDNSK